MTIEKYFVLTIALLMIIVPIAVYPDKYENKEDDRQYVDEKCELQKIMKQIKKNVTNYMMH
ncbi:MAG TPA: hypothetical protein VFH25_09985 [Nitrososphaeraceae archaeon]|jgi:hypothetical protein|nr:hypothetical protein [Nitrososphaeraceae archaeon]